MLDLRNVLEMDVCRDIIRTASDDEIARCVRWPTTIRMEPPIKQQALLDSRFHNALMRMSHNALIKYIYTTLASLMDIYRERVLEATWRRNEIRPHPRRAHGHLSGTARPGRGRGGRRRV